MPTAASIEETFGVEVLVPLERIKVEANYTSTKKSVSLEDLSNLPTLDELIKAKSKFLTEGADVPEENKQRYTDMIVEYLVPFAKIQEICWREIGRTILFVKEEEVYKQASSFSSLVEWLRSVLIPSLKDHDVTNCGEAALQQWMRAVWMEREIALLCNVEGRSNLLELEPGRNELRSFVSLVSNPSKTFAGIDIPPSFVEEKQTKLLECVARAFETISYEPIEDDASLDKQARNSTLSKIQEESKIYVGELLAKSLVNPSDIEVGKYYKLLTTIEWYEPDNEVEGKWLKKTVKGLQDSWVKVVSYDEDDQTVQISPWNVFQIAIEDRPKNQMDADGVILHHLPVAHLDFKSQRFALTEEDVLEETVNADVVLTDLGDIPITLSEYKALYKTAKAKGLNISELVVQLALESLKK